ncbi:hypothetical protein ACIBAC_42860 [Streptomyces sp. NPDC051362]|uniref:hypothetical protein n=1 Tax=Streptomyces sp. NPDC051362 TaxID=3365651 RepID=UPI0037AFC2C7
MIVLLPLALLIVAGVVGRALDKAKDTDITGIVRIALTAIVTLVLTYVAMRVVPSEAVPDLLNAALQALKTAKR